VAEVTNEDIYRELLVLDRQLASLQRQMTENLGILRATVRDLEEGRARIEATKKRYGFLL
jgi:succinate dehydrogenase/fumarate reductase flavoprotein subunit